MDDGNGNTQPSSIVIRGSDPKAASGSPASSDGPSNSPVPLKSTGADGDQLAIPLGFFFTFFVPVMLGLFWEETSLSYDLPVLETCLSSIGIGILCFVVGAIRAARYGLGQRAGLGLLLGYVIPVVLLPASGVLDIFGPTDDGICGLMGVSFVVGNVMLVSVQRSIGKAHRELKSVGRPELNAKSQPPIYAALGGLFCVVAVLSAPTGPDITCLFSLLATSMFMLHFKRNTRF